MTTEFFRKFADLITEAEQVQVRKFAQNRDAERYVMKLVRQGKHIDEILADPAVAQSNLSDDTIKLLWANADEDD
jgi:sugar diacid utilization regulator